jgi:hypothetical protein
MKKIPTPSEKAMKLLSENGSLLTKDLLGEQYEPQGLVKLNKQMKHTKLIIQANKQNHFQDKIFTVVAMTPTGDYIVLFKNGNETDHATINGLDVQRYSPVKSFEGLLIPIQMDDLEEKIYLMRAKQNQYHNLEISRLLASDIYEGDELYKALTQKYK